MSDYEELRAFVEHLIEMYQFASTEAILGGRRAASSPDSPYADLDAECVALRARLDVLLERLRWHPFPGENPTTEGVYEGMDLGRWLFRQDAEGHWCMRHDPDCDGQWQYFWRPLPEPPEA